MSATGPSDQTSDPGRDPSSGETPWESSLSQSSLSDPSATPGSSSTPGFSWPTYGDGSQAPEPTPPANPYGPSAPEPYSQPSANPYGQPQASPYGQPGYDPQPTPPYAGGYDSPAGQYGQPTDNAYGSNPYATNPYASNPYEATPYQAGQGGYGAYGIVPTMHPQAVPALVSGIIGRALCPVVGIVGLVLGGKARRAIDAEPGRYSGRGQATAGWVLGILSIVYCVFILIFALAGASGALE
jgi:hypothetical protein